MEVNCPKCGGPVGPSKFGYACGNWKKEDGGCRYGLSTRGIGFFTDFCVKHLHIEGVELTEEHIAGLLAGEQVQVEGVPKSVQLVENAKGYQDIKLVN